MTNPQHEVAMLVRSIRSAADDLKGLIPFMAQDDIYSLSAANNDIDEVLGAALTSRKEAAE